MGRKRNDSKKKEVHFENAAIQLVVNSTEKPFSNGRKEGECEERKEVQEDVQEDVDVQHEDEKVDDEVQHEESQPTIDQHPTTHLSLLDKVTLGFFVLLNSLGHALKKLARSFLGLFSKDEEEQV